jgi:hypothetical protein
MPAAVLAAALHRSPAARYRAIGHAFNLSFLISPGGAATNMSGPLAGRSADLDAQFVSEHQTMRARRRQPTGDRCLGEVGGCKGNKRYGPELMVAVRFDT